MAWHVDPWLGAVVRIVVTLVVAGLLYWFLRDKLTTTRVNSAIAAVVAVGVLWLADIEGATRLVFLGLEIDRRVESARKILGRLGTLEEEASSTATALQQLEQKAADTTVELKELVAKEERQFEIARLQNAGINGDRDAYEELRDYSADDPDLRERASVAAKSVKRFYIGATRIKGVTLHRTNPEERDTEEEDFRTSWLLEDLRAHAKWLVRARAAHLLARRKEIGVPEALLDAMDQDANLWVAKEALESFASVTGFKKSDVFEWESGEPRRWFEENREDVISKLSPLDGDR